MSVFGGRLANGVDEDMNLARYQEIEVWVRGILEASIFADPTQPGLTHAEIEELAQRRGYGKAEVFVHVPGSPWRNGRILPNSGVASLDLTYFHDECAGDPRNIKAFQWVLDQFEVLVREHGLASARIPLDVLLARAEVNNLNRAEVQAAVTCYTVDEILRLVDGAVLLAKRWATPEEQLAPQGGKQNPSQPNRPHPVGPVLTEVHDIVRRRIDGRALSANAFRAFAETFGGLTGRRIWWDLQVGEVTTLSPQTHPTMMLVGAASLLEAALVALVPEARRLTNGTAFGSNQFDQPPKHWRLEALLNAARRQDTGIFNEHNEQLYLEALRLHENRQRIHFGRFLSAGNPISLDIRPHDAESAVQVTRRVLLVMLEWLAAKRAPAQE